MTKRERNKIIQHFGKIARKVSHKLRDDGYSHFWTVKDPRTKKLQMFALGDFAYNPDWTISVWFEENHIELSQSCRISCLCFYFDPDAAIIQGASFLPLDKHHQGPPSMLNYSRYRFTDTDLLKRFSE